jgi:hypothetical protein
MRAVPRTGAIGIQATGGTRSQSSCLYSKSTEKEEVNETNNLGGGVHWNGLAPGYDGSGHPPLSTDIEHVRHARRGQILTIGGLLPGRIC